MRLRDIYNVNLNCRLMQIEQYATLKLCSTSSSNKSKNKFFKLIFWFIGIKVYFLIYN